MQDFEAHPSVVTERDDLSVELAALYHQNGRYQEALRVLRSRHFQPWEGGEGIAIGQHVRTHVALGRRDLLQGEPALAKEHFKAAADNPNNLGEAKHPLTNYAHVSYWLGVACQALDEPAEARRCWQQAIASTSDFQDMSVKRFSEMTYYRALALKQLGDVLAARSLLHELLQYALQLAESNPKIDYFATSLPAMLLFKEDLSRRNELAAAFLAAQALVGLDDRQAGIERLQWILQQDPNHAIAADFLDELGLETRAAPCTDQR